MNRGNVLEVLIQYLKTCQKPILFCESSVVLAVGSQWYDSIISVWHNALCETLVQSNFSRVARRGQVLKAVRSVTWQPRWNRYKSTSYITFLRTTPNFDRFFSLYVVDSTSYCLSLKFTLLVKSQNIIDHTPNRETMIGSTIFLVLLGFILASQVSSPVIPHRPLC